MHNHNSIGKSRKYVSNASGYPPDRVVDIPANSEMIKSEIIADSICNCKNFDCQLSDCEHEFENRQINYCNSKNMFANMPIEVSYENCPQVSVTSVIRHVYQFQIDKNSQSDRYSYHNSYGKFIDTNVELLPENASSNEYLQTLAISNADVIKHANDEHISLTTEIESRDRKWWITVPVKKLDKTIEFIRVLADPGADIGCINTKWAIDNYKDYIIKNNRTHTIDTPNGKVHPEYAIYLRLPTRTGKFYRAKFVLLDNLPTPILADINMLEAFGYKFRDEIPPIFSHPAEPDLDLGIKDSNRYSVHNNINSNDNNSGKKEIITVNYLQCNTSKIKNNNNCDIYCMYKLNKLYNCNDLTRLPLIGKVANDSNEILFDESHKHSVCMVNDYEFIQDFQQYTDELIHLQQQLYLPGSDLNAIFKSALFNQVNYINNPHYYEATQIELEKANNTIQNPELKSIDCKYILTGAEKLHPTKYHKLYERTMKSIHKNSDVIAKNMYDRRTLNVEPVRLNLKPDCREKRYNISQYPINQEKRIAVINETKHYDNNGFWIPCSTSIHNTPYTVILKKPTANGYIRARMAFDARQINNDCVLLDVNYPTPKDFDDHYSRGYLTTMLDFKGFFDCIPVHPLDSDFLVVQTPLGLRKILHLSYGWKNSAANAQRITNLVCMEVGHMIGFIDDCSIRYPEEWGTDELINHLERLFAVCRKYNLLIHPEKFFPFALEVECLGIKRSIHGSEMTTQYKKRLLSIQKPTTSKELHSALGAINYVTRYLYNHALYAYWLVRLQHECEKKKKLDWTEPANLAWKTLRFLIENAPLLRRPRKYGMFCLRSDGCPYGVGAVLYQKQWDCTTHTWNWVIVDMFSRIIPKNLRSAHCSVHEGLAIVWPTQHWVHYLIRAPFIISTDHKPLINIFQPSKELSDITRKQLYRLSLAMSDFDFTIQYIPGLENKIADQLSRFAMQMIDIVAISPDPMYNDNTKLLTKSEKIEFDSKYQAWTQMLKRLKYNKHPSVMNLNFYNNNNEFAIVNSAKQRNDMINKTKQWLNMRIGVEKSKLHYVLTASQATTPPLIRNTFERNFNSTVLNDDNIIDNEIYKSIANIRIQLSNLKDLIKDCNRVKRKLTEMTNEHLNKIYKLIQQYEDSQQTKLPHMSDNNNNNNNNNNIDTSLNSTEIEHVQRQICQVHTRSFWSKLSKEEHKHTFVQPHMADMQNRMYYRNQFLSYMHDYRPKIDFFDVKTFVLYQDSDSLCEFICTHIRNPNLHKTDQTMQMKFLDLKTHDYQLYKKILHNRFRINKHGILEANIYSTFDYRSKWLIFVPKKLIREILDYSHHNAYFQHFGEQQTIDNVESRFWWFGMKQDCIKWCKNCIVCQFIKGAPTHTAPMMIRELPFPRTHVMADFLGPIYNSYYILAMIDYGSGYCMLKGTVGCGVENVLNMVLDRWVPILGWFDVFESDLGSAFRASLIRRIYNLIGIHQVWSEPRNHKGTGKVERTIRLIQQIINAYNVESGQLFTETNKHTLKQRWETLDSLLPFIQFSLNQKRSRFTNISPNQLMFGTQLKEIQDIGLFTNQLQSLRDEFNHNSDNFEYVECLIRELTFVWNQFNHDWSEYTRITKKEYDQKYDVSRKLPEQLKRFKVGVQIVYYTGDKQEPNRKWRQRWQGPFEIIKRLDDRTVIIADGDGTACPVSIDRIKVYNSDEYYSLRDYNLLVKKRLDWKKMSEKKGVVEARQLTRVGTRESFEVES